MHVFLLLHNCYAVLICIIVSALIIKYYYDTWNGNDKTGQNGKQINFFQEKKKIYFNLLCFTIC